MLYDATTVAAGVAALPDALAGPCGTALRGGGGMKPDAMTAIEMAMAAG